MTNLDQLEKSCRECTQCPLSVTREHVAFGTGPAQTPIMFIGEGPGQQEDAEGTPFVGPAGQLLDEMLCIIDLSRENSYITNIVKCRPPQNRDPMQTEQDACLGWLRRQTSLINPKIVVCLGRISATKLMDAQFKITRDHGTWMEKDGIWFTALYHPSALLRDVTKRPETFRDLKGLQAKIKEICPDFY